MRRVFRCVCCLLLAFSFSAVAAEIPIGTLTYLGDTTDGSSVFHIILTPPPGVTFDGLITSLLTDGTGRSFSLPAPQTRSPLTYNFLLVTSPSLGFTKCPCRSVSLLFAARPGAKVLVENKKQVLLRVSATVLDPLSKNRFLVPQQSTTVFLSTHGHKKTLSTDSP
jgi:hypothetical protein